MISTDLVIAYLMAFMVSRNLLIDESNQSDMQLMSFAQYKVRELLNTRGHWIQDYSCEKHQCSASECNCLEQERATHHYLCGSQLVFDGGGCCCPLCDSAVIEIELELESPTPPAMIPPPVFEKDCLPSGHWRRSVKTP
jgi:hypothetical protein